MRSRSQQITWRAFPLESFPELLCSPLYSRMSPDGEVEDALQFLELAKQAPLLPEEQELVTDARQLASSP